MVFLALNSRRVVPYPLDIQPYLKSVHHSWFQRPDAETAYKKLQQKQPAYFLKRCFSALAWRLHFQGAGNEKQHVEAFMLEQKLIPFRRPLVDGNKAMKESVFQKENELHRMYRLKRYFSPQIAEIVLKCPDEDSLWESHRQEVTVVVLDLRGFTRFANNAEPEEVMALLRNYHAEMGRLVFKFDGTLERFTGDGMMVFFNDTVACEQQTKKAVTMALEMRDRAKELRTGWRAKGYDLDLGIGLAAGYATVGNFGFEGRMDYGVVGKSNQLDLPALRGGERRTDPDESKHSHQDRRLRARGTCGAIAIERVHSPCQCIQYRRHQGMIRRFQNFTAYVALISWPIPIRFICKK